MKAPKRIGVVLPSTNPVVEPDFYRVVPREVTVHFERIWTPRHTAPGENEEDNLKINEDLERAGRFLGCAPIDLAVYACTGGSYCKGTIAYDREVAQRLQQATGVPAITAVGSSVEALRHLGIRKMSVVGPCGEFMLQQRLKPLLEEAGFEVLRAESDPSMQHRTDVAVIPQQDPRTLLQFVPQVTPEESEAVFLPGTAWRAMEIVDELERRLKRYVVTVNQATIWMALRKVGVTQAISGFGYLLARGFDRTQEIDTLGGHGYTLSS